MSDLGWRADGIARARAAGGIELERYRRPGFAATEGVRRAAQDTRAVGWTDWDPDPAPDYEWSRASPSRRSP